MNEIIKIDGGELSGSPNTLAKNPAAAYLASLTSATGIRTQQQALGLVVDILAPGRFVPPAPPSRDNPDFPALLRQYHEQQLFYKGRCFLLPWHELRAEHTNAVRAALARKYAPATANRALSALRKTLYFAWKLGIMEREDYNRAADLASVSGSTLPAGRNLDSGEIAALMQACEADPTPAGARDAAVIALLYTCGMRRDELARVSLADYEAETGALKILHAKRGQQRIVYVINNAARALSDWLAVRGDKPGALFVSISKVGKLGEGMTAQAFYNLLKKRAAQGGVKHFSPHDFRRTFVGDLLDAGEDLSTAAKLAGHRNVTTTQRYDRRGEQAKRRAASRLHVPYKGRKTL